MSNSGYTMVMFHNHDEHGNRRRPPFGFTHPVFVLVCLVIAAVVCGPTIYANISTNRVRYEPTRTSYSAIPSANTAIVLGAGLQAEGSQPSPYLRWRIETAVALYKAGKVDTLLMSGARMSARHDEPRVMQATAEALGVPSADIVQDVLGFDTYDSCRRAYTKFGVRSAIVVTQGYHVPRAVISCRHAGITTIGVNAHTQVRSWRAGWYLVREWLATDKLMLQIAREKKPRS
jgi:vancomycin permeability regulator SanA